MEQTDDKNSNIFSKKSEKVYGIMELVNGNSLMTSKNPEETIFTFPHLLSKVLICSIITISLLLALSLFIFTPLNEISNPNLPPYNNPTPWYLLGIHTLVSYDTFIGGVCFSVFSFLIFLLIPYIDSNTAGVGIWFSKKRPYAISLFSIFIIINLLLIIAGAIL